ncbi:MAG: PTS sugar transporter subunit IIA [Planctomycetota bacterium]
MKLSEVLRSECVVPGLALANKEEVLKEVVRIAKKCSVLESVDTENILKGLKERENLGSTGFGSGIAIPHCRLEEVPDFVVGVITVPEGVDFGAVDNQKVRLIAFIIGPSAETTEHLRILSALSLSFGVSGVVQKIVSAQTSEDMIESLIYGTKEDIDLKGHTNKRMFHVVVQDETLFSRILGAFESLDSASVTVLEGKNAGEYLMAVPLFASLFTDNYSTFNRIILAVVGREMTNEAIRRIESITGHLDRCKNVIVAVQDIFYAAGSIEI